MHSLLYNSLSTSFSLFLTRSLFFFISLSYLLSLTFIYHIILIISYLYSYQPDADSVDTSNSTLGIALLFIPVPSFPLARGLMYFSLARVIEEVQDTISYKPLSDPFDYISKYLLALFGHMCLYLFVLVIILLVQAHSDL